MVLIKYGSLLLSVFVLLLCPRLHAETLPEIKAVIDFVSVGERLGALLHYSQTYLDDQHERVTYRGTLYTAIRQLTVDGCEVKVRVVVQDRFSGSIAKHKKLSPDRLEHTGFLVDDTVHEYDFALNDLEREGISDFLARPQDLLNGTGFQCDEIQVRNGMDSYHGERSSHKGKGDRQRNPVFRCNTSSNCTAGVWGRLRQKRGEAFPRCSVGIGESKHREVTFGCHTVNLRARL
jgi:hypothetical protein